MVFSSSDVIADDDDDISTVPTVNSISAGGLEDEDVMLLITPSVDVVSTCDDVISPEDDINPSAARDVNPDGGEDITTFSDCDDVIPDCSGDDVTIKLDGVTFALGDELGLSEVAIKTFSDDL